MTSKYVTENLYLKQKKLFFLYLKPLILNNKNKKYKLWDL